MTTATFDAAAYKRTTRAQWEDAAEEVGRLLAEGGCTVVTGGLGGVMAAAHRGAKAAGGVTIAILPGESRADANPWADHVVVTRSEHIPRIQEAQASAWHVLRGLMEGP